LSARPADEPSWQKRVPSFSPRLDLARLQPYRARTHSTRKGEGQASEPNRAGSTQILKCGRLISTSAGRASLLKAASAETQASQRVSRALRHVGSTSRARCLRSRHRRWRRSRDVQDGGRRWCAAMAVARLFRPRSPKSALSPAMHLFTYSLLHPSIVRRFDSPKYRI
jgi:hypothetical protein